MNAYQQAYEQLCHDFRDRDNVSLFLDALHNQEYLLQPTNNAIKPIHLLTVDDLVQ